MLRAREPVPFYHFWVVILTMQPWLVAAWLILAKGRVLALNGRLDSIQAYGFDTYAQVFNAGFSRFIQIPFWLVFDHTTKGNPQTEAAFSNRKTQGGVTLGPTFARGASSWLTLVLLSNHGWMFSFSYESIACVCKTQFWGLLWKQWLSLDVFLVRLDAKKKWEINI